MSAVSQPEPPFGLDVDLDVLVAQLVDQVLLGVVRIGGLVLRPPLFSSTSTRLFFVLERDLLDLARSTCVRNCE